MSDWGDIQDAYGAGCKDGHARLRKRTADLERQLAEAQAEAKEFRERSAYWERELSLQVAGARAALEHIVRECGALNKGPVAVAIARAALASKP